MTAVLDVPEIRDRVLRVSVADYRRHTEGQRTELLHGIVIEKMSRSPLLSYIADARRETSPRKSVRTLSRFAKGR